MTEDTRTILNQLELTAGRLTCLTALMEAFLESDPFAQSSSLEQRYASNCCYTAISELSAYYAQSANDAVEACYRANRP